MHLVLRPSLRTFGFEAFSNSIARNFQGLRYACENLVFTEMQATFFYVLSELARFAKKIKMKNLLPEIWQICYS